MTRREWVIVVAVTLLGAVLRLFQIGAQSFWFDELLSLAIGRLGIERVVSSPASIDPPIFYILLHFWLGVSRDDGVIRLLSAASSIAAILAIYVLGKRLIDNRVGMMAACIIAVSPLQIYFAQETRMYSWLVLLAILSMWAYVRAQDTGKVRDWTLWGAIMVLAIYTHLFAGLVLVALDVDALWRWRAEKNRLQPVMIANLIMAVVLLPLAVLTLQKMSWLLPALWLQPPSLLHPLMTLYLFAFGYAVPVPVNFVGLGALLGALAFAVVASWHWSRESLPQARANLRLMWIVLIVPIAVVFIVSQWKSVYVDRLLLEASPALYLVLAWALGASNRRNVVRSFAVIGLPLVIFSLFNYYTQPDYARPPLRDVIRYVSMRDAPNELVIHTSDSSFLAGRFYDPNGNHQLLYHPSDQWLAPQLMIELDVPFNQDAARLISGKPSYWVVVALDHIPEEQLAEKAWFDRASVLIEQAEVGQVGVYHYAVPGK